MESAVVESAKDLLGKAVCGSLGGEKEWRFVLEERECSKAVGWEDEGSRRISIIVSALRGKNGS
jgi:hypothetical protein